MTSKSKNKSSLIWLWALWPIGSAIITLLMLMIDVRAGFFIAPVYELSMVSVVVSLSGVFVTAYAAYSIAKSGAGVLKAILIGNAIPIICIAVLTVLVVIGKGESDLSVLIGSLGTGIFQIPTSFLTTLIGKPLSYFEVYIAFAALMSTFAVGYAIGFSKIKK